MSTPLNIAVDIIRAVSAASTARVHLDVELCALELSSRHLDVGYSTNEIAEILAEEAAAAGVLMRREQASRAG